MKERTKFILYIFFKTDSLVKKERGRELCLGSVSLFHSRSRPLFYIPLHFSLPFLSPTPTFFLFLLSSNRTLPKFQVLGWHVMLSWGLHRKFPICLDTFSRLQLPVYPCMHACMHEFDFPATHTSSTPQVPHLPYHQSISLGYIQHAHCRPTYIRQTCTSLSPRWLQCTKGVLPVLDNCSLALMRSHQSQVTCFEDWAQAREGPMPIGLREPPGRLARCSLVCKQRQDKSDTRHAGGGVENEAAPREGGRQTRAYAKSARGRWLDFIAGRYSGSVDYHTATHAADVLQARTDQPFRDARVERLSGPDAAFECHPSSISGTKEGVRQATTDSPVISRLPILERTPWFLRKNRSVSFVSSFGLDDGWLETRAMRAPLFQSAHTRARTQTKTNDPLLLCCEN